MSSQATLGRKTKQEVLEEYEKLSEQYEELKMTSKLVYGAESRETIDSLRGQTKESISKTTGDFKQSANLELSDTINKINTALESFLNKALAEMDKFNDLQEAIEISKKNLALHYNIQVGAETLERLVAEYEKKKDDLAAETVVKKRDWEREQEEYAYNLKLQRRKENDVYEEERASREKELAAKEEVLRQREEDCKKLQQEADDFPKRLEREVVAKEREMSVLLNEKFKNETELMQKDWVAEKRFYELRIENLENQIKKQDADLSSLKKEAETANKKAQELAVKIIERGHDTGTQERSAKETT